MGIILSDNRYEEIKRSVVLMFDLLDVHCVPISGFELATKMTVKVIPYSAYSGKIRELMLKKSLDGFCLRETGHPSRIFYNDSSEIPYGRINNTLLHEIGHIILDHTEDSELAEKEVQFFAKYALAPPVLIHKLKLSTSEEISATFDISYEAARYALVYYEKWRFHTFQRSSKLKDYEEVLLKLFNQPA